MGSTILLRLLVLLPVTVRAHRLQVGRIKPGSALTDGPNMVNQDGEFRTDNTEGMSG